MPFKSLTLQIVNLNHCSSEIGKELEVGKIDGHQKRIPAKIVEFPHFDPKKLRVRS